MYTPFTLPDPLSITSITSLFSCKYKKGYHYKGEIHDFSEIIYIKHGSASICIDENFYQIDEGDLIQIAPNKFHNFICEEKDASVTIISFNATGNISDKTIIFKLDKTMKNYLEKIYLSGRQLFCFDGIQVVNIKDENPIQIKKFKSNLELFLIYLFDKSYDSASKKFTSPKTILYSKIIKVLNENINFKLTLNKIAQACNTSVSNIKTTFNYFTNDSIIRYFTKMKIQKSKELLLNGFSIKETSAMLGYNEQNYFSNVFKKLIGTSPKTWLILNKIKP